MEGYEAGSMPVYLEHNDIISDLDPITNLFKPPINDYLFRFIELGS